MLGSGFWLMASERFDPRTARRHFAQIAGAGTLGGLVGGLLSERAAAILDVAAMLPILAAMNLACGWLVRQLTDAEQPRARSRPIDIAPELSSAAPRSGLRVLADARYLRDLAALVLLGTAGAALMDYVFKAQAVASLGRGDALLRFFAIYYAAISLITFVIQAVLSQPTLETTRAGDRREHALDGPARRKRRRHRGAGTGRARSWRAAPSRPSAARSSDRATRFSTRRSRRTRSAPPNR